MVSALFDYTRLTLQAEVITHPRDLLRDLNDVSWLTDAQLRELGKIIRPHIKVVRSQQIVSDALLRDHRDAEGYVTAIWNHNRRAVSEALLGQLHLVHETEEL